MFPDPGNDGIGMGYFIRQKHFVQADHRLLQADYISLRRQFIQRNGLCFKTQAGNLNDPGRAVIRPQLKITFFICNDPPPFIKLDGSERYGFPAEAIGNFSTDILGNKPLPAE